MLADISEMMQDLRYESEEGEIAACQIEDSR
jgi:hypothetical protein